MYLLPICLALMQKRLLSQAQKMLTYKCNVYLQLQLNDVEKATNAAFTYLTHNPDDKVAESNYNWYINEVTKTDPDFVSVDREAHVRIHSSHKSPFVQKCTYLHSR